jgi:serine/threonine protein kinase/tetratricopeptide (TPR) repeat protein
MSEMDTPRREDAILEAVLELPPHERPAYLDQACQGDARLRRLIEGILQAHRHAASLQESATQREPGPTMVVSVPVTEQLGDRIGPYKILQQIGEGGCGVVYMAEQQEPVKRRVALKVIKLGMDTKQVIGRFEAERQALALMDHPNIAKVLDAGATGAGRPFFVMELVRGIKITDYCDQNNAPMERRLELFIHVCKAIQHAHQKGIIHRDIKPSNILITLHDGVPIPKVIDFGIAKATSGQTLTNKTVFTAFEQFIGTPAYMSPEQAEMSGLDIDTRSDIYALGVLLYELLTGKTPFDQKELIAAGLDGMRRMIREQDPVRPSTRLSSLNAVEQTTTAKRRQVAVPKLVHIVRGDLDWIVMKCLEKDRTRRYETASGLAVDIQNHLQHEPVMARPPSRLYRLEKVIRRNKLAFAAGSSVLLSLVIGLGLSTWLFVKEKAARQAAHSEALRSERVLHLLEDALEGIGPDVARGQDTKLLAGIVERTVNKMPADLQGEPEATAKLCNVLGRTYRALGKSEQAVAMHRRAKEWQEKCPRLKRAELDTLRDLARALLDLGGKDQLQEAKALQTEILQRQRALFGEEHVLIAETLNDLGLILRKEHDLLGAEQMHLKAVQMQRKLGGEEQFNTAFFLNNLALVLLEQKKLSDAETNFVESLALQEKLFDEPRPQMAQTMDSLAFTFRAEGKLVQAETLGLKALDLQQKLMGEHPQVATTLNNLALAYAAMGDRAKAETFHRNALAMRRKVLPADHLETASSLDNLAMSLRFPNPPQNSQERLKEAEDFERQSLTMRKKLSRNESYGVGASFYNLGLILRAQNRLIEAESSFRDALRIGRKVNPDDSSVAAYFRTLLDILVRQHKTNEIESVAADILTPSMEAKAQGVPLLLARADARARSERWSDARSDFLRVMELQPDNYEPYHCLAAILAQDPDATSYRNHCSGMLSRFGATADQALARRVATACLILPNPGMDLNVVEKLVEKGTNTPGVWRAQLSQALVAYRGERFEPAMHQSQSALEQPDITAAGRHQGSLILAMAQHKSQKLDQARALVDKVASTIANRELGSDWTDTLFARALFRQAAELINYKAQVRRETE